jgi:hypothetical protein
MKALDQFMDLFVIGDNQPSPLATIRIPHRRQIRSDFSDNHFSRARGQVVLPGRIALEYRSRVG